MTQYFDAQEHTVRRQDRCAQRIHETRLQIWTQLGCKVADELQYVTNKQPGLVEFGGFSRNNEHWLIKRIIRPAYEVTVALNALSILIEHEFRTISTIPGEVERTLVEFRCDADEQVILEVDGKPADIPYVSRLILEPIVTGRRPR